MIKVACHKCGGYGWLWWNELDEYDGPAVETGQDDTRYTCDACGGKGERAYFHFEFEDEDG